MFHSLESYKGKRPAPLSRAVLWRRLSDIGKEVKKQGIIKRDLQFSPHLFRRTFATLLYKAGMDLKALQGATRHASIETLAKHYVDSQSETSPYFEKILEKESGNRL